MDNYLLFEDFFEEYLPKVGNELFTHIFFQKKSELEDFTLRCGLIPNDKIEDVLKKYEWDLTYEGGQPDFVTFYNEETDKTETIYQRYGNDDRFEPLLINREFSGIVPDITEISEEFRLFHNLFFDNSTSKYVKFDVDGEPIEIIIQNENEIKVRTKELKEFLLAKNMALAIYFQIVRFSEYHLAKSDTNDYEVFKQESDYYFHLSLGYNFFNKNGKKTCSNSLLIGKKLIVGFKDLSLYDYINKPEPTEYEEFIVAQNIDGSEIKSTCDPDKISKEYLSPVYFKKEVLKKYYDNTDKYEISDNYLSCYGLWGMQFDNNHAEYTITALGDLGHDLSIKEQKHWRSYNIPPVGEYSETTYKRWIKGEFIDSDRDDTIFKSKYREFQDKWFKKNKWYLFLPLNEGDEYHLKALRIPLTNNQKEFDNLVLSIVKIIIDSINEGKLNKFVTLSDDKKGSITKLEKYFQYLGFSDFEIHIKFLRNLQELRSSAVAHRKGSDFTKISKVFQIGSVSNICVFEKIMKSVNDFFDYLLKISSSE
ncbi:MAG: hypothetical protein ABFD00_00800 [Chloroherpetonaceae bacterium]